MDPSEEIPGSIPFQPWVSFSWKKPQELRKKSEKSGMMVTHVTTESKARHGSTKNPRLAWATKRGLEPSFKRKQKGGKLKGIQKH